MVQNALPKGGVPPVLPPKPKNVVLIVVLSIVGGLFALGVVLAAVMIPILAHTRAQARRVACMNNIRQIGLASIQYEGNNDGAFMPLVDESGNTVLTWGQVPTQPSRTGFLLLLKQGYISTATVFICPGSKDEISPAMPTEYKGSSLSDLRAAFGENNCSYGWDPTKRHSASATCALMADKPALRPGKEGTADNNSENHAGAGQSVFYNDGHTAWGSTPQGDTQDDPDIYTGATTGYGADGKSGYELSDTDAKIIR